MELGFKPGAGPHAKFYLKQQLPQWRNKCLPFLLLVNFILYFWLRWVFVAAHGLSPVMASEGYSLAVASLVVEHRLWSAGSVAVVHGA